jgi:hypothetical protein
MTSAYALDESKKTKLRFDCGLEGSFDMCALSNFPNLSPLIQYYLPIRNSTAELYLFGAARNLRGRGLQENLLNSEDEGQARLRQPASLCAGSEISSTTSAESLSRHQSNNSAPNITRCPLH